MDISKAKKPVHIQCPYCHKDLQYNGASIKSRKEGAVRRVNSLNEKIQNTKSKRQKEKLILQREETLEELKVLSENVHMLSQLSELEILKIFKRKAHKLLSEEQYVKLCKESEQQYLEDNTFNYYDLAIQNFNHFDNC